MNRRTVAGRPVFVLTEEEFDQNKGGWNAKGTVEESLGGAWLINPWEEEKYAAPNRKQAAEAIVDWYGPEVIFYTTEDRADDLLFFCSKDPR